MSVVATTTRPARSVNTSTTFVLPSVATTTRPAHVASTTTIVERTTTTTHAVERARTVSGYSHACAWVRSSVWCWGSNHTGELGEVTGPVSGPVQVTGLEGTIAEVAAGDHTTCARNTGGRLWCWGFRMGGGSDVAPSDAVGPQPIQLAGVTDVAIGLSGQVCAATKEGGVARIYCWGDGWTHQGTPGFDGGRFTSKPVLVWEGKHVHDLQVGYRTARAHVGFTEGGCGWIRWGESVPQGTYVND